MPCELLWNLPAFLLPRRSNKERGARKQNAESHWGSATSIQSLDFDLFLYFPGSHAKQENYSAKSISMLNDMDGKRLSYCEDGIFPYGYNNNAFPEWKFLFSC